MQILGISEGVRVEKTLHEREEKVDEMLTIERIEIEHVLKNERVDGPLPVREEGDTVIVPVVKQVLRVEKEWVLAEEIHLKRRRETRPVDQVETLEYEEATIDVVNPERHGILGGPVPAFKGMLERWPAKS
jgi:hypothetical protein